MEPALRRYAINCPGMSDELHVECRTFVVRYCSWMVKVENYSTLGALVEAAHEHHVWHLQNPGEEWVQP